MNFYIKWNAPVMLISGGTQMSLSGEKVSEESFWDKMAELNEEVLQRKDEIMGHLLSGDDKAVHIADYSFYIEQ